MPERSRLCGIPSISRRRSRPSPDPEASCGSPAHVRRSPLDPPEPRIEPRAGARALRHNGSTPSFRSSSTSAAKRRRTIVGMPCWDARAHHPSRCRTGHDSAAFHAAAPASMPRLQESNLRRAATRHTLTESTATDATWRPALVADPAGPTAYQIPASRAAYRGSARRPRVRSWGGSPPALAARAFVKPERKHPVVSPSN